MISDDDWCAYRRHVPNAIDFEIVNARFPEAIALFDTQASSVAEADDVQFLVVKKNGRLHARSSRGRVVWDPVVALWIRASFGISSKPRRSSREWPIVPVDLDADLATEVSTLQRGRLRRAVRNLNLKEG